MSMRTVSGMSRMLRSSPSSTRPQSLQQPLRSLTVPSQAAFSASTQQPNKSPSEAESGSSSKQGIISSFLRGSDSAKAEGQTTQSHSTSVARGKYIHEIQRHDVKSEFVDEYKQVVADYFPKIVADNNYNARLTGSWEVTVGEQETFYHIWEYDGYAGYDKSIDVLGKATLIRDFNKAVRPLLRHRSNFLCQEFAFWPTASARELGGIYELRTYHLNPGKLLEWEQHWRKGLEARRKYTEPVGAWFSQIGKLHTVFHIWQYPSLDKRKETRDAAWQVETWNDTVSHTVRLINSMHAQIMKPLPFSPLR
ncbi:unnamed protein product [Sympodiomycopsis kandeliae]